MAATTTEVAATETASANGLSPGAGRHPHAAAAGALLDELFRVHGRMVLGLCRVLLRDPHDAEDAAQQVFLSAHAAVLRGSRPRDAAPWLATIARNECRARIRMRMRQPLELPEISSDLPDPLVAAIRALDLDAVWSALAGLPRRQRRAILMRELGGMSYHELGRALGVSHSAVESLLFRARRQLRATLTTAQLAAAPIALRDALLRLLPGFDPGGVSAAVKVASAAALVGVAVTSVAELPEHRAQPVHHRAVSAALAAPVVSAHVPGPKTGTSVHVAPRRVVHHVALRPISDHRRRRHHGASSSGSSGSSPQVEQTERVEIADDTPPTRVIADTPAPETAVEDNSGPGNASEPATVEEDHSGKDESGSGSDHGPDDGSDHSGPGR